MSDRLLAATSGSAPLTHRLKKLWHPAWYQDGNKRQGYFEGWYFKCVDAAAQHAVALIPGISLTPDREGSHAFVQLIRAGGRTAYWEYPAEEFRFATDRFEIEVGPNRFSSAGVWLDMDGEAGTVKGELRFGDWVPWPVRPLSPGIMGWYRFVPFMETYHGVLGLDHSVDGELEIAGSALDYHGGRGYVEKDWGRSFPSAWVWAQSNHFDAVGTSVTISVARIPWLGGSFVGYIVGLLHDGVLHEFTTHNGAKMRAFSIRDGEARMALEKTGLRLELTVEGAHPGELRSPVLGSMAGTVWESLDAQIGVRLSRGESLVFEGRGLHAGVELMDETDDLEVGLKPGRQKETTQHGE
ncbi:MAG: tocopherol cyclase family protein [Coriobacteriia bacterium]|nr:tocopherol cyclase family protein [Coriobacteriia bacterium]